MEQLSDPPTPSSRVPKTHQQQQCRVCGKILSSPASYYVHMKQHSSNKPYECKFCDVAFSRKPYLDVHLRTHTGERPFKCEFCSKCFTQKSSLNTHKRVHTGKNFTSPFRYEKDCRLY